ncbi:RluA family pseudouridine synthase [Candidatus Omnitrophota bacterium]
MKEFTLRVETEDAKQRLDLYLFKFSQINNLGLSRNLIQNLIKNQHVVSPGRELSSHYKIKPQEVFIMRIPEKTSALIQPENIPLVVIFEDADVIVVNKPCGMVVHPGAGNSSGTLVNALLFHCVGLSGVNPQRPGIVHRLDKDTSGLIVAVKNDPAHQHLTRQFSQHSVLREYAALVKGKVELDEDIIELPIGRHPRQREKMSVSFDSNHRYAKTHYRVLKRSSNMSLLELKPFTGRTHQLRVHLSFLGHPILGDKKYGDNSKFGRMALHAYRLGFIHPVSNKLIDFKTEIPTEFIKAVS